MTDDNEIPRASDIPRAASASQDHLLSVRHRIAEADRLRPWVLDGAIMALVAVLGLSDLNSAQGEGPFGSASGGADVPRAVLLLLLAGLVVPLWWRRRAPVFAFGAIAAVMLIVWLSNVWLDAGASLLIVLYSVARYASLRALAWCAVIAAAEVTAAALFLMPIVDPTSGLFLLLGTMTAGIAMGLAVRTHGTYLEALEERAARLEIERNQRVRLTAAQERSRVAREMHDIIGHNLAVMIGLADGGAVLASRHGERAAEPLRAIGDTGRQALAELRLLLGVIREEPRDPELNPQPMLADLDAVLQRVRAAGLTVTYQTSGDVDSLGRGVQLTVYRIIQEALTNTLKHASTAAARVSVGVDGDDVRVRVTDSGPHPASEPRPQPADPDELRHGLVGIRERASLYHGDVTIGPRPGGGWMVDVLLHTRAALDAAEPRGGQPS